MSVKSKSVISCKSNSVIAYCWPTDELYNSIIIRCLEDTL